MKLKDLSLGDWFTLKIWTEKNEKIWILVKTERDKNNNNAFYLHDGGKTTVHSNEPVIYIHKG